MAKLLFETDWGWWGVVSGPRGITRVVLPGPTAKDAAGAMGGPGEHANSVVRQAARQIREYLCGRRQRLTVPVDWEPILGFARQILGACAQIGYGQTVSYSELARRAGKEGAARAVGQALAANRVPLLVPCHRVVRADGSLGGFSGGLELKRRLLRLEGAL